jgi:hydrogenase expression/formation protein HypC
MCLGVPGKVKEIVENPLGMAMGKVSFGGITKEVCLAYLPEVRVGDYVLVHVGFALSRIDEKEAAEVFELLREMGELAELDGAQSPSRTEEPGGVEGEPPCDS